MFYAELNHQEDVYDFLEKLRAKNVGDNMERNETCDNGQVVISWKGGKKNTNVEKKIGSMGSSKLCLNVNEIGQCVVAL